jgi:hypothetical protein
MKNAFTLRPSVTGLAPFALALVAGVASVGYAQTITAVAGSGSARIDLAPHAAMVAFVTSDASSAQEALQGAVVSAAEGKAIVAFASKTLPIPVIGALPVEGAMRLLRKFEKHAVKGFDVAYIQGVSSEAAIQRGETSFTIPAESLQGLSPLLLRVRPSTKDSARIVRSLHVTVKMTASQVNPATTEVLGIDQEAIPSHLESGAGGNMVLTPNSPLASGEYAVVLAAGRPSAADATVGLVWDFRVQ